MSKQKLFYKEALQAPKVVQLSGGHYAGLKVGFIYVRIRDLIWFLSLFYVVMFVGLVINLPFYNYLSVIPFLLPWWPFMYLAANLTIL